MYWVRHQIRISQPWDLTTIDLDVLGEMSQQCDLKGQTPEVHIPPTIDVKNWSKVFELICEHLDRHRVLMGNRLS